MDAIGKPASLFRGSRRGRKERKQRINFVLRYRRARQPERPERRNELRLEDAFEVGGPRGVNVCRVSAQDRCLVQRLRLRRIRVRGKLSRVTVEECEVGEVWCNRAPCRRIEPQCCEERVPRALQRMERTIELVPNSADAWTQLGVGYLHVGRIIGRQDWKERAQYAFLTALRLDPAARSTVAPQLADLAFLDGDVRQFATYANATGPQALYKAAILSGTPARIHAARPAYVEGVLKPDLVTPFQAFWLTGAPIPQHEVDTLLALLSPMAQTTQQRCSFSNRLHSSMQDAGRPSRADGALTESFRHCTGRGDTAAYRRTEALQYAFDDSLVAEESFGRWRALGSEPRRAPVGAMLSRLRRGDTTGSGWFVANRPPFAPPDRGVAEIIDSLPPGNAAGAVLDVYVLFGVLESFVVADGAALRKADSLIRIMPRDLVDPLNYDLALAFARRGEYAMAASAAHRRVMLIDTKRFFRHVIALRMEGRWAAMAGDTASAIKAYREYLLYRESPEPVLVPQRDSVVTELNALMRARGGVSPAARKAPPKPETAKPAPATYASMRRPVN